MMHTFRLFPPKPDAAAVKTRGGEEIPFWWRVLFFPGTSRQQPIPSPHLPKPFWFFQGRRGGKWPLAWNSGNRAVLRSKNLPANQPLMIAIYTFVKLVFWNAFHFPLCLLFPSFFLANHSRAHLSFAQKAGRWKCELIPAEIMASSFCALLVCASIWTQPCRVNFFCVAKDKPTSWTRMGRGGEGGVFPFLFRVLWPLQNSIHPPPLACLGGRPHENRFCPNWDEEGGGLLISFSFFSFLRFIRTETMMMKAFRLCIQAGFFVLLFRKFLFIEKWTEKNAGFY